MSNKRWLIRTRSKQILGPASLEKIISLLEKNTLKEDDELSCGNGYWFWVKEKDLVDKYIYQGIVQEFDPIGEATTVLCQAESESSDVEDRQDEQGPSPDSSHVQDQVMPSEEDLEFPDVDSSSQSDDLGLEDQEEVDDLTVVVPTSEPESLMAEEVAVSDSEMNSTNDTVEEADDSELEARQETQVKPPADKTKKKTPKTSHKKASDRYLFILLLVVVGLVAATIFYFKTVLNKPIPLLSIASVYAQPAPNLVKKKVL